MVKSLKDREWKDFQICKLFEIKNVYGKPIENYIDGNIPYISTSTLNNGLISFVKANERCISSKNAISIDPIKGKAFFHEYNFVGRGFSGASINLLYKKDLNKYVALFLCKTIENTALNKASYGYLFNSDRLKRAKIMLPINSKGEPDYEFMEEYIKEREIKLKEQYKVLKLTQLKKLKKNIIDNKSWCDFRIKAIFPVLVAGKSKGLNHLEQVHEQGIPYLGATNRNNGVLCFVEKAGNEYLIQKGNCIAFIRNGEGSMGYSIYKSEDFIATSDITVGYNNKLNKYSGMFITTIADRVRGKYSFNYKRSDTRLKKEILTLPVTDTGEPDYEYMESYMKYLEQKKLLEYLDYIK